jgi:hypothetical protein
MSAWRGLADGFGGLWELFMLAARSGFRLRGAYWQWRYETAFGSDPARRPSRAQRLRAILAYGRWVYRMKRGR